MTLSIQRFSRASDSATPILFSHTNDFFPLKVFFIHLFIFSSLDYKWKEHRQKEHLLRVQGVPRTSRPRPKLQAHFKFTITDRVQQTIDTWFEHFFERFRNCVRGLGHILVRALLPRQEPKKENILSIYAGLSKTMTHQIRIVQCSWILTF